MAVGLVWLLATATCARAQQDPSALKRAQILLDQHKSDDAIRLLRGYMLKNPRDPWGFILLGRAYAEARQPEKAAAALRQAATLAPRMASAHLSLGVFEAMLGNTEAARKAFLRVLELEPGRKEALFNLGKLLFDNGEDAAAVGYFNQYLAVSPSDKAGLLYLLRIAIRRDDSGQVRQLQDQLASQFPTDLALHAQVACRLAESRHSELSQTEFERVIALASGAAVRSKAEREAAASHCAQLGACYERARRPGQAASAYEAAIRTDPDREEAYVQLARLLAAQDRVGPAHDVMSQAAERFPQSVNVRIAMGSLELDAANLENAMKACQEALALDPYSAAALVLRGRVQMAERRFPEAISNFERAASLDPKNAQPHFYAGRAWMRMENGSDRAIECFQRSLRLDQENATTFFWLGSLYLHRKHDYRTAASYLEEAVKRAPALDAAHQVLIQAYKLLGDEERAARQARHYRDLRQSQPDRRLLPEDRP